MRIACLTSIGGDEAGHSNLGPLVLGLLSHVQRTTTVTIAHTLAIGRVNTHDAVIDNAVNTIAGRIVDDREIFNHLQLRCNSSSTVCILTPANWSGQISNITIGLIFCRWKTGRADVVIELNLLWQADQGNVIFKIVWVPVRVGEPFI